MTTTKTNRNYQLNESNKNTLDTIIHTLNLARKKILGMESKADGMLHSNINKEKTNSGIQSKDQT